jgi:hypothetical protein
MILCPLVDIQHTNTCTNKDRGRRGHDRMVVGFIYITTYATGANHH